MFDSGFYCMLLFKTELRVRGLINIMQSPHDGARPQYTTVVRKWVFRSDHHNKDHSVSSHC